MSEPMVAESLRTPLCGEYDVVVAGGGPAGVTAAITAARSGARTLLIEVGGCLGGVWTRGMLAWVFDFDQDGFTRQLTAELDRRDARIGRSTGRSVDQFTYDIEQMKLLLEQWCLESGVEVLLHARVVGVLKEGRQVRGIVTESRSGRQAWVGRVMIDATGDGDLGALAGCGFDYGHGSPDKVQPMTFMALVTIPDPAAISDCIAFYGGVVEDDTHAKAWKAFGAELARCGIEPSYNRPTLFQVQGGLLALMINHEYGVCPMDARQVTAATMRGRAEVARVAKGLSSLGGRWEKLRLVATADQIGVRDGRRIHGRYRVSVDDILDGARHADAVARVRFGVDVHSFTRERNRRESGLSSMGVRSQPYDVPLRALVAGDVDGLLMAGRCISGDYLAHASYRVTGNAVAMGEAAGVVAALAAKEKIMPHELLWEAVAQPLGALRAHSPSPADSQNPT